MREIKFRAWEKHAKRMAEVTAFKWQPDHLYHQVYTRAIVNQKMIDEWYAYDFGGDSNGIILMQYTGLKDKNGKEIFDGDVHEYNGKRFPVAFGTFIDEESGDELYGWYIGDPSDATRLDENSDKYMNIIGNIHEEVQE